MASGYRFWYLALKAAKFSSASSFFLLPNSCEFGADLLALAMRNGIHDIALFMDYTPLAQRRGKQRADCCQKSIMPISHDQIELSHSTVTQILQEAAPAIFVFLCTGPQSQHIFVPFQIHTKGS